MTYDQLNAAGNSLSTNTITQKIVANQLNALNVTLNGIAASLQITPALGATTTDASLTGGIQFFASTQPTAIDIVALDADHNFILGPGAPTFTATVSSASARSGIAIAPPSPGNPNRFVLQATGLGTAQLAISTAPGSANMLGATLSLRSTTRVSTLAGTPGVGGFANGPGSSALFNAPQGIAYDPTTKLLFVADACAVRQVTLTGDTTTLSGDPTVDPTTGGVPGCGFKNGPNAGARFNAPTGIATNPATGDVYVTDTSCTIRQISRATGMTTLLIGNAPTINGSICGFTDGAGASAKMNSSGALAFANGNIYVADTYNCAIRQVSQNAGVWTMTTIAGSSPTGPNSANCFLADGTGNNALFGAVGGITFDSANGNLYVADTGAAAVRQLHFNGTAWETTTIAGSYPLPKSGYNDGSGKTARFSFLAQLSYNAKDDTLFLADLRNCSVRRIAIDGDTSTAAGGAPPSSDCGLSTNGLGSDARFSAPFGVAVDPVSGDVFVTDLRDTVRRIEL